MDSVLKRIPKCFTSSSFSFLRLVNWHGVQSKGKNVAAQCTKHRLITLKRIHCTERIPTRQSPSEISCSSCCYCSSGHCSVSSLQTGAYGQELTFLQKIRKHSFLFYKQLFLNLLACFLQAFTSPPKSLLWWKGLKWHLQCHYLSYAA